MHNIPFIHMMKSPGGHFFFDVNKNDIVPISKDTYKYLSSILVSQNTDINPIVEDEIETLLSEGYLSYNKVKEVSYPYLPLIKYYLNRKLLKVTLQVTRDCNLRCKYCIYSEDDSEKQRSHAKEKMSYEVGKRIIDFFVKHSTDSEKVNIGFYGGEPLLEFELIKKLIKYSKNKFSGKELTFNVTTNGTMLNDEIIQYFIINKVHTTISVDGPKEIHDKNRVFAHSGLGTFDVLISKVNYIKENYPEYIDSILFSMVIDPTNDIDCINTIEIDLPSIDENRLFSTIVDKSYTDEDTVFSYDYYTKSQYNHFIAYLSHFQVVSKDNVCATSIKVVNTVLGFIENHTPTEALPYKSAPSGPCIPGQSRLLATVDGEFYPCERVSESSPTMNIGNIDNGFDIEKVYNLLNIGNLTGKKCKNCWAFTYCMICARYADNGVCTDGDIKLKKCDYSIKSAELQLYEMLLFREIPVLYGSELVKRRKCNERK